VPPNRPEGDDKAKIKDLCTKYATASDADQYRFVFDGEAMRNKIKAFYRGRPRGLITAEEVVVNECVCIDEKQNIYEVDVTLKRGGLQASRTYYVRRTVDGYLIDWPPTAGFNETTIRAHVSSNSREQQAFRVEARLSDFYSFEYAEAKPTHLSLSLSDGTEMLIAYVPRDSELGKRVFALLKDGNEHKVTLRVSHGSNESNRYVELAGIVSESWYVK
jgi:hypothetical protein